MLQFRECKSFIFQALTLRLKFGRLQHAQHSLGTLPVLLPSGDLDHNEVHVIVAPIALLVLSS